MSAGNFFQKHPDGEHNDKAKEKVNAYGAPVPGGKSSFAA
jgi:hypothetical protein